MTMMGLHMPENGSRRPRDPFEVMFSASLTLSALVQLLFGAAPGSLIDLLPQWALLVWVLLVLVGGVATLAGVFWRDRITGLFIESIGLSSTAFGLGTYALAINAVSVDGRGNFAAALTFMLAVAFAWKYIQVRGILRRLPR